jgi:hypothetical protein
MGYRITVCDARAVFATRKRFPSADEIVVAWPVEFVETAPVDGCTVICVLLHDPKSDVPACKEALKTPAWYIGAMGSRRTHDSRTARLMEEGVTEEELERICSPVGLDIGARTREENAVAIAGVIISLHTGHSRGRLAKRSGPIHVAEAVLWEKSSMGHPPSGVLAVDLAASETLLPSLTGTGGGWARRASVPESYAGPKGAATASTTTQGIYLSTQRNGTVTERPAD